MTALGSESFLLGVEKDPLTQVPREKESWGQPQRVGLSSSGTSGRRGCSPLILLLLTSFCVCVCVCFVCFCFAKHCQYRNHLFGFLSIPHHPAEDGHLLSQPAEAEEGWNEHSEGHQNGKHEAAVVRGIGVRCAGA